MPDPPISANSHQEDDDPGGNARHELHPNQVSAWKRQLRDASPEVFARGAARKLARQYETKIHDLHAKIGELTVERDFSSRVEALSRAERMRMVKPDGSMRLSKQCAPVGVGRSSLYYRPKGESAENLALMRRMDELHTNCPFCGSRQMMRHLRREGCKAGRHRIRRLMRLMGVEAVYRRPRTTSAAGPEHRVFPYLLRGLEVSRANHVWCADITYIPVSQGFFYLVAVMDRATRHVLAWRLSNTMDASFCIEAPDAAPGRRTPEILNTDQGSQFTGTALCGPGPQGGRPVLNGRAGPLPRQHLNRAAVAVAEVRGRVPLRASGRGGCRTDHRLMDRLLQRGAPALVSGRAGAGRSLPRRRGENMRTIRRGDAHGAQPARRRLRARRG